MKAYRLQNTFSLCEHTKSAKRFCCLLGTAAPTETRTSSATAFGRCAMRPGHLRSKELDRLDVLSVSPHSIKDFPFVYSPKTEGFKAITSHSMAGELLQLSARLTIPGLYKSAHTFTAPPLIHFGHQLASSSLPSPLR
jgi:hypothetical protein